MWGRAVSEIAPVSSYRRENAFTMLRQFARKPSAVVERCEMCSRELSARHEHLVEPVSRKLVCACNACAILFESQHGTKYKRVPRQIFRLEGFQLTDSQWEALSLPIEMAFFFKSTPQGRVIALYPSPAGATESLLSLGAWAEIESANPVLRQMDADVTALLVNRAGRVGETAAPDYYLVPIDECYKLVGLIRMHWRGFSGGTEVWREINSFFSALKQSAETTQGGEHA